MSTAPKTAPEPPGDSSKVISSEADEQSGGTMKTFPHEVDLVARALDILGSPNKLANWMQSSLPALQGRTPYSLMNSEEGRKQVENLLGRIEHGIF